MATILVIDDTPLDRKICVDTLKRAGYSVLEAETGIEGLRLCEEERPDLVLLDVLMPGMDGWRVCQRIREFTDTPVILFTSLNREAEMTRGLELGADDFISKPVSQRHLGARIAAVLRRSPATPVPARGEHFDDGVLAIEGDAHRVTLDGKPVELTPTEFRLLAFLAAAPGKTRSYTELLGSVWGPEYADDIDFLRVYVWRIRKKLAHPANADGWIRTDRGFGYRFETLEERRGEAPAPVPDQAQEALVLVVEDDDVSARLMRDVLAAKQIATSHCSNGLEVQEMALRLQPAVVVMDVGLPGIDGVEATRRLKEDPGTRSIPVVAVTAYADSANELRVREAGCDGFLTKPVRLSEFAALVQGFLPPRS